MTIDLFCPCGKSQSVSEQLAGSRVKCPVCGEFLIVPEPASSPLVAEEPASALASAAESKQHAPAARSAETKKTKKWALPGRKPRQAQLEIDEGGQLEVDESGDTESPARSVAAGATESRPPSGGRSVELTHNEDDRIRLNGIAGRPGRVFFGFVFPSIFGRTELLVRHGMLYEDTRRVLTRSQGEYLLSCTQGAEIRSVMHPLLLPASMIFFGNDIPLLGILFLAAFLLLRVNYLQIHSSSHSILVKVPRKGNEGEQFMKQLLNECRRYGEQIRHE